MAPAVAVGVRLVPGLLATRAHRAALTGVVRCGTRRGWRSCSRPRDLSLAIGADVPLDRLHRLTSNDHARPGSTDQSAGQQIRPSSDAAKRGEHLQTGHHSHGEPGSVRPPPRRARREWCHLRGAHPRCPRSSASVITSAYLWCRSKRFTWWLSSERSNTASSTTTVWNPCE